MRQIYCIYGIYLCIFVPQAEFLKKKIYEYSKKSPLKRKIIDLDENTFKTLSIMAIQKGTNLKNYIETLLNDIAEDYEDAKIYAKLSKEQPEGLVPVSKEEQDEFEQWLGV